MNTQSNHITPHPAHVPQPDAQGNWPMPGPKDWDSIHDDMQPDLAAGPIAQTRPPLLDRSLGPICGGYQPGSYAQDPVPGYHPQMPPGTPSHALQGQRGPQIMTPGHHALQGHPGSQIMTPAGLPQTYYTSPQAHHTQATQVGLVLSDIPLPITAPAPTTPTAAYQISHIRHQHAAPSRYPHPIENIGALRANISNTAEFIRVASPIFDIPEHKKWPAAVVLILAGLQDMKAELVSHIVAELKPQAAELVSNIVAELKPQAQEVTADQGPAAAKSNTASGLKAFLRSNLHLLLVKGELDVYGRLTSCKATAAVTPFSVIKVDNAKWNLELDSMITLALKAKKYKIVSMLQDHLPTTGKPPAPVPQLSDLVTSVFLAMLPRYKDSDPATILREVNAPAKARLAHMRLIFNLN
ncbi:hypothetical protein PTTG_06386 [Puccinia triticina 1-1 BBBD Race 1]|uniref:Uncharacterized protein n=1 Tax=Puccinia triticina (isolate 1-1 / race 1 (BBBD)) TaxID=630390 RepID=A0A180G5C6_PUCT1|nr:hypothetical protein PTTG_06386 [Puccinia triticina 1-1 BBBD Race 1]